jgi:membrane associated rhomboid family serine protease
MAFFKKYNGTTDLRLLRLERVIWILIYGGLLSTVLSGFARDAGAQGHIVLLVCGLFAVVLGVALIVLRSRLREEDKRS